MTITVPRTRKFYIWLAKIPGIGPHVKWATHRGKKFHLLSTCDLGGSSNLVRSSLGAGHPLERGGWPAAGWSPLPAAAPRRRSRPPRPPPSRWPGPPRCASRSRCCTCPPRSPLAGRSAQRPASTSTASSSARTWPAASAERGRPAGTRPRPRTAMPGFRHDVLPAGRLA